MFNCTILRECQAPKKSQELKIRNETKQTEGNKFVEISLNKSEREKKRNFKIGDISE